MSTSKVDFRQITSKRLEMSVPSHFRVVGIFHIIKLAEEVISNRPRCRNILRSWFR